MTILTDEKVTTTPRSNLQELAETFLDNALTQARQRLSPLQSGPDLPTLLGTPAFLDDVKYDLACKIAEVLSENDKSIRAIYTFDPSANPDCEAGVDLPLSATVHLLVRVTQSSAALEAFIAALDRALTAELRALPSARFERVESMLDVNLVTEQQVQLRTGYGALLSSLFAPPIQVWQRDS